MARFRVLTFLGKVFATSVALSCVKEVGEVAEILFPVSLTVFDFEIRRDYNEKGDIKYLKSSVFYPRQQARLQFRNCEAYFHRLCCMRDVKTLYTYTYVICNIY